MPIKICRDTFEGADEHTKQLLIFDMLQSLSDLVQVNTETQKTFCDVRCKVCDSRMKTLENKKLLNGGLAAGGGFVGGFVAIIIKIRFWG